MQTDNETGGVINEQSFEVFRRSNVSPFCSHYGHKTRIPVTPDLCVDQF